MNPNFSNYPLDSHCNSFFHSLKKTQKTKKTLQNIKYHSNKKKKKCFLITANLKTFVISIICRNIAQDTGITSSQETYIF